MRRFLLVIALVSAPAVALAQPGDWGAVRDPFDPAVIGRYKAILRSNPHEPSALANLLKMYRQFRTVDLLKDEYQKLLDKTPDDWASLVVMGRLQHTTGDDARALDLWQKAVAKKDDDAQTWLYIGEMLKQTGKNKEARAAYDKGLAHASGKDMKKKALRALADLALATNDTEAANTYFKQFLDLDPSNAQLWMERGDAMLAANKFDVALESYSSAEKLLGSDPARRVEVVARRGQALQQMHKFDEAVAEYRRAIKLAPKGYYLEVELTGKIIDIYRNEKQALPQLLAQYEKEWPEGARGHFEWATLGKLYEETGAQDKAIAAFKRAVQKAPWELETQRRLIALLRNSGRDEEVLAQYEAVVRIAPGDARSQLELAETYWGRGQEKKALDVLTRLEGRFPSDGGVLSAIADLYQRWGKDELAIAEYERLAKLEPDDPEHLRTLGDQYWQKNDKARAFATWKRIIANGKAISFAKYGDVLAEHGSSQDAITQYAQAIKLDPKNPELYKGRAAILEQMKDLVKATADWEQVLALIDAAKPQNRLSRRDARRRYVQLIVRQGTTELAKKNDWERKFAGDKPDLESGYFLIEYYAKKNKPSELLATLRTMHAKVADDQDVWLDLVKVLKQTRKYDEAVELLKDLAKTVPSREREAYQLIAEIMTEARRDDEAIAWAQKALAKSPNNPDAYERLGERYVEMQRFADAIEAYERAVKLAPTNSKSSFALAELYVQTGVPMKAAELLRNILRASTDEETVSRAATKAIDLEEMTDTLGELEKVLSPLSFMMAHKPVYRRVLVNLYVRYVPRLVERVRHGNDEVKKAARIELDRIGAHGLRPLLEALRDEKDTAQQRVAVAVLGHLGNKGAAAPLVHMARQEPPKDPRRIGTLPEGPDHEVRIEALVAAGRLGDPAVLADVLPLMEHTEVSMREAATFALGRSGDKRAVAPLLKALADRRGSVQVLACLGLAQVDDARVGPALVAMLADARKDDTTRGACAYAIGTRRIASALPTLLATLADNRGEAQRLSAWALGQVGDPRALGPLIRAYFARAGRSADELVWAIGRVGGGGLAPAPLADLGEYPLSGGKFDPRPAVALLPGNLPRGTASAKLVAEHADDIIAGLKEALAEHRDVVVSALGDLDAAPTAMSLGALTAAAANDKVAQAMAAIAGGIEAAVVGQLASDDPKVRALALSVLTKLDGGKVKSAEGAIAKAMTDPADQVRAAAMQAIPILAHRRNGAPPALVTALVKALGSPAWGDRRVAAMAMGELGAGASSEIGAALTKAAADSSSFVREATATAFGQIGGTAGVDPLLVLSKDEVVQVRAAAARALGRFKDERAQKRRAELAKDPDASVREAAGPSVER